MIKSKASAATKGDHVTTREPVHIVTIALLFSLLKHDSKFLEVLVTKPGFHSSYHCSVTLCLRSCIYASLEYLQKFSSSSKGECILSAGGYTKRPEGPGFILINNPKKRRLVLELSTTSKLWTLELNVKRSWVHLMFTWKQKMGLVLYENGEFLTEAKTFQRIRYPSFTYKYRTLTVGAQDNLMKLKSGGVFEIGHLVIWTRSLSAKQIQSKSFLHVVRRSVRSIICCEQKYGKQMYIYRVIWTENYCFV